jgi:lipopolysaccharide/colanic/teichoic acid biosynthesis glycosyltransferase
MIRNFTKRSIDLLACFVVFIVCAPLWLVLWVMVRWKIGSPVFFRQIRPGKDEKLFEMIKFRTMTDARDESGELLEDAKRMTGFGTFLRASSLDEFPEFWNVLKGQMSVVGPRPLLVEYLPLYNQRQQKRHDVRPGITGWAQVNGRNAIQWDDKLEMDAWYVENRTIWLDIKIILMTFIKVVKRSDISEAGHVTKEKFRGSSNS